METYFKAKKCLQNLKTRVMDNMKEKMWLFHVRTFKWLFMFYQNAEMQNSYVISQQICHLHIYNLFPINYKIFHILHF